MYEEEKGEYKFNAPHNFRVSTMRNFSGEDALEALPKLSEDKKKHVRYGTVGERYYFVNDEA